MEGRVAAGGRLLLSGLLTGQVQAVADAYAAAMGGCASVRTSNHDPEWSAAVIAPNTP